MYQQPPVKLGKRVRATFVHVKWQAEIVHVELVRVKLARDELMRVKLKVLLDSSWVRCAQSQI